MNRLLFGAFDPIVRRSWAALALAALVSWAMPAHAEDDDTTSANGDSLEIRFIGNAGVELYDGETTLLVDLHYRSGSYGSMRYDPKTVQPRGDVVCLITHRHVDHFDVRPFQRNDWKIIAPQELTKPMPAERVIPLKLGIPVGEFVVAPYKTPHAGLEHYSYVVGWKGRKLYFSGDTEVTENLRERTNLAIAFVTPWLGCKVAEEEATIDAERVVLYHHRGDGTDEVCGDPTVMEQGDVLRLGPAEDYDPES